MPRALTEAHSKATMVWRQRIRCGWRMAATSIMATSPQKEKASWMARIQSCSNAYILCFSDSCDKLVPLCRRGSGSFSIPASRIRNSADAPTKSQGILAARQRRRRPATRTAPLESTRSRPERSMRAATIPAAGKSPDTSDGHKPATSPDTNERGCSTRTPSRKSNVTGVDRDSVINLSWFQSRHCTGRDTGPRLPW